MESAQMPVFERVRHYIDDVAQLSRKQVAANMGFTESKLSLLLSGKRKMSVDEYAKLCRVLAVKPERFMPSD